MDRQILRKTILIVSLLLMPVVINYYSPYLIIQGSAEGIIVGSMVFFEKGKPKPDHYRRFRIKTVEGANDYAMLQEVLRRRFKRSNTETKIRTPVLSRVFCRPLR